MSVYVSDDLWRQIYKAVNHILMDSPFFGSLLLRMELVPGNVGTACTDGRKVWFDPEFFASLEFNEIKGALVHETAHPAFGHPFRMKGRDHKKWNVACDIAINPIVEAMHDEFKIPKAVCKQIRDWEKEFCGLSAEEIYAKLPDSMQLGGGGSCNGCTGESVGDSPVDDPGRCGAVIMPTKDEVPIKELERNWEVYVKAAAEQAKAMGSLPGALVRILDAYLKPKVDWQAELLQFAEQAAYNDYAWSQPDRRYLQYDVYLPNLISNEVGRVVCVFDTSGSVDTKELTRYASEVNTIMALFNPHVTVIYSDAGVAGVEEFEPMDYPIDFHPKGGGGTDFRPAFRYIEKEGLEPAFVLFFTDLCGKFPDEAPDYPVLWVTYGDLKLEVPFGKHICME